MEIFCREKDGSGLSKSEQLEAVRKSLEGRRPERALLIPPDYTRRYSGAGWLACCYYNELKGLCPVDVLPALGTHAPMTEAECADMYPDIPFERFIVHNWRRDAIKIGEISGGYLSEITEGLWSESIAVEVNRLVMDRRYELIVSIARWCPMRS
jgi:nickel-dependent lactate racemase